MAQSLQKIPLLAKVTLDLADHHSLQEAAEAEEPISFNCSFEIEFSKP
jgi:hypothetical protein